MHPIDKKERGSLLRSAGRTAAPRDRRAAGARGNVPASVGERAGRAARHQPADRPPCARRTGARRLDLSPEGGRLIRRRPPRRAGADCAGLDERSDAPARLAARHTRAQRRAVPAPSHVAAALELPQTPPVYELLPAARWWTTHRSACRPTTCPRRSARRLEENDLSASLYRLLEIRYGLRLWTGQETLRARGRDERTRRTCWTSRKARP